MVILSIIKKVKWDVLEHRIEYNVCVFPVLKIWKFEFIYIFYADNKHDFCSNKFQLFVCVRAEGRGCDKQQTHCVTLTREGETTVEQTIK